jgi:hypothetical protein
MRRRRQFRQGPGRDIPEPAQRRPQHHQQGMNPRMGFALAHPEQPPLYDLEGRGLQVDQDQPEPILGRGERAVGVGRVATGRAWFPVEAPGGHVGLEGGLKGRHSRPTLVHRETGQIEYLCRAGLQIGEPSRAHGLLSLEAQYPINRD